jgi:hypothetical protein
LFLLRQANHADTLAEQWRYGNNCLLVAYRRSA